MRVIKTTSMRIDVEKWKRLGVIAKTMRMNRAQLIELMVDFMDGAEKMPFGDLIEQTLAIVLQKNIAKGKGDEETDGEKSE